MVSRRIRHTSLLALAALTISCSTIVPSSHTAGGFNPHSDIEKEIRNVLSKQLAKKDRTIHDIPADFQYDSMSALEDAAESIAQFLDSMDNIVLYSELSEYVDNQISKRLSKNGISSSRIPSSIKSKFDRKRKSIIKQLRRSMSYNDDEYISKLEIKSVVKSEIDYQFIKEIKESSTGWGHSIGTFVSNVASTIGSVIDIMGDNNDDDDYDDDYYDDGYVEVVVQQPIVHQTVVQPVIEEIHYVEPVVEHYNVVDTPAYNPEIYEADVPEYEDVMGDEVYYPDVPEFPED